MASAAFCRSKFSCLAKWITTKKHQNWLHFLLSPSFCYHWPFATRAFYCMVVFCFNRCMALPLQRHCNFLHSTAQDWCLGVYSLQSHHTSLTDLDWARTSREHVFSNFQMQEQVWKFECSLLGVVCHDISKYEYSAWNQTPVMAFGALSRSSANVVPAAQTLHNRFRTSHIIIAYCKKKIRKESRNIMCIFAILWSYFLLPRQRPSELLWRYNDHLPAKGSKARPKSLNLWLVELAWIFCRTQEAKSSVSQNIQKRTRSRGVLRWVVSVCASLVCVSCKW